MQESDHLAIVRDDRPRTPGGTEKLPDQTRRITELTIPKQSSAGELPVVYAGMPVENLARGDEARRQDSPGRIHQAGVAIPRQTVE
jgi:hypothetical protein